MTYAERVRAARNPPEALLAIAEGIDEILSREPTTDAWSMDFDDMSWPTIAAPAKPQRDEKAIAAVEEALRTTTDGKEVEALQARLRVLTDEGRVPLEVVPEGERPAVTDTGDTLTVDLPAPSPARKQGRAKFAQDHNLWEFLTVPGLTAEEFVDAWAKGGPLWLYYGDRDAIMTMPLDWRRTFVNDVQADSPALAQEIARDILKDTSPQDAGTVLPMGGV